MKQVIIFRRDLKLRRGKEIAQGAHASMGAYFDSMGRWGPIGPDMAGVWEDEGKKKVVLKVEGVEELLVLAKAAESADLGHYLVRDAGHTEVEPGTITALGIGPNLESLIDKITGELELY